MVWRLPLHSRTGDGYSDDIPENVADELVKKFCATSIQSVPLRVGVKLQGFDEHERVENWPFRELVGSLMWLSISTRPDIGNAVRAVARYSAESHPLEGSPWHLEVYSWD